MSLFCGLLSKFDATVESIMLAKPSYQKAVSTVVVRKIRLNKSDKIVETATTVQKPRSKIFHRCYICGTQRYIATICMFVLSQKDAITAPSHDTLKCYICRKFGHIARYRLNKNDVDRSENSTVMLVMPTMENTCVRNRNQQRPFV